MGLGEEFPYQKLIKTVPSIENSEQQGSGNGEKPEADVSLYDETSQKPYQSLSLKRNPMVRIFFFPMKCFSFNYFFNFFFSLIDPCKVSKIPKSREVLLVKSGILDFSILNSAQVIRNPGFSEIESIIQDCLGLLHPG